MEDSTRVYQCLLASPINEDLKEPLDIVKLLKVLADLIQSYKQPSSVIPQAVGSICSKCSAHKQTWALFNESILCTCHTCENWLGGCGREAEAQEPSWKAVQTHLCVCEVIEFRNFIMTTEGQEQLQLLITISRLEREEIQTSCNRVIQERTQLIDRAISLNTALLQGKKSRKVIQSKNSLYGALSYHFQLRPQVRLVNYTDNRFWPSRAVTVQLQANMSLMAKFPSNGEEQSMLFKYRSRALYWEASVPSLSNEQPLSKFCITPFPAVITNRVINQLHGQWKKGIYILLSKKPVFGELHRKRRRVSKSSSQVTYDESERVWIDSKDLWNNIFSYL